MGVEQPNFTAVASGFKTTGRSLPPPWDYLRLGDVLVVWQLCRLGHNVRHLIDTVNTLHETGVQFRSPRETSTPPPRPGN